MTRTLRADDPDAIAAAASALGRGGLVALPTETVYGVACALNEAALERLVAVKGRDASKGITLSVDTSRDSERFAILDERAQRLAARFWPGPLTLVLPLRADAALPDILTGGAGRIGVRVPDHPTPRALARAAGPFPLTSANRSGEPAARTAAEAAAALGPDLSLVLDGGPAQGGVASTVVAVDRDGALLYLRDGAIPRADIEAATADRGG